MASNRFFTILIVPEKSDKVAKLVIPSYVFKGGILSIAFVLVLALIMILDYANVMSQIKENRQLKIENRQLKQSVQVFKTKIVGMENTLDRVKTFVTKLRIITNIEDTSPLPDFTPTNPASAPVPASSDPNVLSLPLPQNKTPMTPVSPFTKPAPNFSEPAPVKSGRQRKADEDTSGIDTSLNDFPQGRTISSTNDEEIDIETDVTNQPITTGKMSRSQLRAQAYETARTKRLDLLQNLMKETPEDFLIASDESSAYVEEEFKKLDLAYEEVQIFALSIEQETQDILEKLSEKRSLLASTPTRIPTFGYVTSDYGVRISPIDGRRKMHEGIDIANRFGSDIIAPADGLVTFSGVKPGYGKLVVIDHGNGIETRFAHNSRMVVDAGARVKRGQTIAMVGSTGHSTGPHCHYEVHANGLPVDPCWYILDQPHVCRGR